MQRVGEQASPGPPPSPQSPTWSFPAAAAAWLAARRGGGELRGPTQRLSASVPRWQGLQRPPETRGSVSCLQHWPPTLPPSLPTPATRLRHTRALAAPEARGRCAVVALRPRKLLAGEQALAGSPGRQCWPIFALEGSWEPKACFPVVSWRITALDPTRRAPRAARRRARQDQRRERAGLPGPGAASPLCGRGRLNCPRLLPRSRAAAASGRWTSRG